MYPYHTIASDASPSEDDTTSPHDILGVEHFKKEGQQKRTKQQASPGLQEKRDLEAAARGFKYKRRRSVKNERD